MDQLSPADLRRFYDDEFAAYRDEAWARKWRSRYVEQVRRVQEADRDVWLEPAFQEILWDAADISGIGPGQSVTVVDAYADAQLADLLFDARGSLDGLRWRAAGPGCSRCSTRSSPPSTRATRLVDPWPASSGCSPRCFPAT